jgi:hypothetical protein
VSSVSSRSSAVTAGGWRRYRFLDLLVEVRSERAEALRVLDQIYGGFAAPDEGGEPGLEVRVRRAGDGLRFESGETSCPLAPPPLADFHAYSLLFGEVLRRVGGVYFVHGAAVADASRTLVLSGPGGHGKTTLGLALLAHGFRLLSDDFAPIERAGGRVRPFPKRVGVRRKGGPPALPAGVDPSVAWTPFGDKWLLDPADLPGGPVGEARPLTHLLLLESSHPDTAPQRYRMILVDGRDRLEEALGSLAGLRCRTMAAGDGRLALEAEVEPRALPAFHEACAPYRHRMLVFEPEKPPAAADGTPRIEPLGPLPAALGLMREVLNRAPDGRLAREAGGEVGPLVMELAGLLRSVRCGRLRAGRVEETTACIVAWMGGEGENR